MADKLFEVQAALLFETSPQVHFGAVFDIFKASLRAHDISAAFDILQNTGSEKTLSLTGAGMHATIQVQHAPRDAEEFILPLRAPILRHKDFDFRAAIKHHQAAILITVGDGEAPRPVDVRDQKAGSVVPADPILKLTVLHLLMQAISEMCSPVMVSFCPSQSLLTPQEVGTVSELALPIPILFHPFPFSHGKDENGAPRMGMAAIHTVNLIGAELEMEDIPADMPIANRINLLATLIAENRSGNWPLEHGDVVQTDGNWLLNVRREEGSKVGGPRRIVVQFDGSSRPPPKQKQGQEAFKDRIARLKSNDPNANPTAPMTHTRETPEDLRARVQDTINPGVQASSPGRMMSGPVRLIAVVGAIGLFFVLGPVEDLTEMAVSQATSISSLIETLDSAETITTGTPISVSSNLPGEATNTIRGAVDP